METVDEVIAAIKPRSEIGRILRVKRSRVQQLIGKDRKPFTAELLARIAQRHLIAKFGRAKAAKMILATLEADFPLEDANQSDENAPSTAA